MFLNKFVTFIIEVPKKVNALRTAENAMRSSSGWVLMDAAEALYLTATQRVFSAVAVPSTNKKTKKDAGGNDIGKIKQLLNKQV